MNFQKQPTLRLYRIKMNGCLKIEHDAIRSNHDSQVLSSSQSPRSLSLRTRRSQLRAIRSMQNSTSFLAVRNMFPISLMLKRLAVRKVSIFLQINNIL